MIDMRIPGQMAEGELLIERLAPWLLREALSQGLAPFIAARPLYGTR
jgi:hypothetical protein